MPTTMKLEDGSEAEVFTAEEIEAQKQAAIDEYKANNPDKSDELAKAQLELEGFKNKDLNFGTLRKQKEEAEKKVEDILKGVDDRINKAKTEVLEGVMKDHYNDNLKALSSGDAELQKKIEYHYKRLGDPASTKEELSNKLRDAYILATKPAEVDALNSSVLSSGGVGRLNIKSNNKGYSSEETTLAKKLGLSEEDLKKHG